MASNSVKRVRRGLPKTARGFHGSRDESTPDKTITVWPAPAKKPRGPQVGV